MRHDETPKVDEMDAHLSGEHYCPPPRPERRGTTFVHARPEDYVTEEHQVTTSAPVPPSLWQRFWAFETPVTPLHVFVFAIGWTVGQLIW